MAGQILVFSRSGVPGAVQAFAPKSVDVQRMEFSRNKEFEMWYQFEKCCARGYAIVLKSIHVQRIEFSFSKEYETLKGRDFSLKIVPEG